MAIDSTAAAINDPLLAGILELKELAITHFGDAPDLMTVFRVTLKELEDIRQSERARRRAAAARLRHWCDDH